MARARSLLAPDWSVTDVSGNRPYDLHCTRPGEELHVEVKGTTAGPDEVILTANEVRHHRDDAPESALVIVHSIEWRDARRTEVQGGETIIIRPWTIDEAALRPISYRYDTPRRTAHPDPSG